MGAQSGANQNGDLLDTLNEYIKWLMLLTKWKTQQIKILLQLTFLALCMKIWKVIYTASSETITYGQRSHVETIDFTIECDALGYAE